MGRNENCIAKGGADPVKARTDGSCYVVRGGMEDVGLRVKREGEAGSDMEAVKE